MSARLDTAWELLDDPRYGVFDPDDIPTIQRLEAIRSHLQAAAELLGSAPLFPARWMRGLDGEIWITWEREHRPILMAEIERLSTALGMELEDYRKARQKRDAWLGRGKLTTQKRSAFIRSIVLDWLLDGHRGGYSRDTVTNEVRGPLVEHIEAELIKRGEPREGIRKRIESALKKLDRDIPQWKNAK